MVHTPFRPMEGFIIDIKVSKCSLTHSIHFILYTFHTLCISLAYVHLQEAGRFFHADSNTRYTEPGTAAIDSGSFSGEESGI